MTAAPSEPLVMNLTVPTGVPATPDRAVLGVCFANVSSAPVRMLAETEPAPVFFSVAIVDSRGTPLPSAGGGKADFGPGGPGYVQIDPGDDWCVDLRLASLAVSLPPGVYRVLVLGNSVLGRRKTISVPLVFSAPSRRIRYTPRVLAGTSHP